MDIGDPLAVAIAFLSGIGSVIGGWFTLRRVRKEEQRRCDERVRELFDTYERALEDRKRP